MLDPLARLDVEEVLRLIDDKRYFVLHAPRQTGKTTSLIALMKRLNEGGRYRALYVNIESAQAEGLDIRGQVLSRPVGMLMGHPASMSPFSRRPSFLALQTLPPAARLAALRDPDVRARILAERNVNPHMFVRIFEKRFDTLYPLKEPINYLPEAGTSVADRAAAAGQDPEAWLYDYFLGNEGANLVYIPATNFTDNIPTLLRHRYTVSALGDGGAHVGSICDTSANLYVLTKWVKERREIDLPTAIHLLTRQPAELYSLHDRGLTHGSSGNFSVRLDDGYLVAATSRRLLPRAVRFATRVLGLPVNFEITDDETLARLLAMQYPMRGMDHTTLGGNPLEAFLKRDAA